MVRHVLLCALGMWNPQSITWGHQGEAGIEEERSNWHFQCCLYQVFCISLHTYLMLAEAQILVLVFKSLV